MNQGVSEDHCAKCGLSVCLYDEECRKCERSPVIVTNGQLAACAGIGLMIGICFSLLLGLRLPDFLGGSERVAHLIVALLGAYGGIEFGQLGLPKFLERQRDQKPCRFEKLHVMREEERQNTKRERERLEKLRKDPNFIRSQIVERIKEFKTYQQEIFEAQQRMSRENNPHKYQTHLEHSRYLFQQAEQQINERKAALGYLDIISFVDVLQSLKMDSETVDWATLLDSLKKKQGEGGTLLETLLADEGIVSTRNGQKYIGTLREILKQSEEFRELCYTKWMTALNKKIPSGEDMRLMSGIFENQMEVFDRDTLLEEFYKENEQLEQQYKEWKNQEKEMAEQFSQADFFTARPSHPKEPIYRR